nr:MAG TPA: hypothetical protein [Caudoviricetes sp.]
MAFVFIGSSPILPTIKWKIRPKSQIDAKSIV